MRVMGRKNARYGVALVSSQSREFNDLEKERMVKVRFLDMGVPISNFTLVTMMNSFIYHPFSVMMFFVMMFGKFVLECWLELAMCLGFHGKIGPLLLYSEDS